MERNDTFTNSSESTDTLATVCSFPITPSFADVQNLFENSSCYKHSSILTAFLICFNLIILLLGWFGNFLVIYVVCCKLKRRSASSLFIVNLAVADSLLLVFCIPPTLLVNIFTPWILGEYMCKGVTYAQGVSVGVSVYSLVAISADRCRAAHPNCSVASFLTKNSPGIVILLIWLVGLIIPLPWLFVFQLRDLNSATESPSFPFCHDVWPSKGYELGYFFISNMLLSYILPLILIIIFNILIWRAVLQSNATSMFTSRRKYIVVKVFTFLTFAFFLCWCPLYIVMTRVKVFYSRSFQGTEWEQMFMAVAVPIAQLLGPINSCLNPVLYASLNKVYKNCLLSLCSCCSNCLSTCKRKHVNSKNHTRANGRVVKSNAVMESCV